MDRFVEKLYRNVNMSLIHRVLNRNCIYSPLFKTVRCSNALQNCPLRIRSSDLCYKISSHQCNVKLLPLYSSSSVSVRTLTSQNDNTDKTKKDNQKEVKKPGLIQRFKQMSRDYWYVLLPVHGVTCLLWYGGFYYLVRSGVDVIALLEYVGVTEKLLQPLRESKAGYFALAFACYKIASPLRYAVTVGVTTLALRKLIALGLIKPVPSSQRLKEMMQEKKDNLQERYQESKQTYKDQLKEFKDKVKKM